MAVRQIVISSRRYPDRFNNRAAGRTRADSLPFTSGVVPLERSRDYGDGAAALGLPPRKANGIVPPVMIAATRNGTKL